MYVVKAEAHLTYLDETFDRLSQSSLAVNFGQNEIWQVTVDYFGHTVGQGKVKPIMDNVDVFTKFPPSTNNLQLMKYLGMIDFTWNSGQYLLPLTHLLRRNSSWVLIFKTLLKIANHISHV